MISIFRNFMLAMLGMALAVFGVFHTVSSYPGPDVFSRLISSMPTITAFFSFVVGVVAALAGLAMMVPSILRLGWGRQKGLAFPTSGNRYLARGVPTPRSLPGRQDDDFDPEADPYAPEDYDGGSGTAYRGRHSGNGEYDERRWAGSYR